MGYSHVASHKSKAVKLWQQGDITCILTDEPGTHARDFLEAHGPCAPSMGWRVVDAGHALRHALAHGAEEYTGPKTLDAPAIIGIGGSLIYFIEGARQASPYNAEFDWTDRAHQRESASSASTT